LLAALDAQEVFVSGLNINCGDFPSDDKSGSAFEQVLKELHGLDEDLKNEILAGLDEGEFTLIQPEQAQLIIAPLTKFKASLVREIGHEDWAKETEREELAGADPVELKWGKGRGWKLYCARNLLGACHHSVSTSEPIAICLC
jgi:hypothetical protein